MLNIFINNINILKDINMASLILLGFITIILGVITSEKSTCINCSFAHKKDGLNYVWLNKEFGKVLNIEYEEPVEQKYLKDGKSIYKSGEMIGKWKPYTDEIWGIHCRPNVIDHSPEKLVEQHMTAFINPETRFARLRFTLEKDGEIYQTEPNERFYELEKEFFQKNRCHP